MSASSEGGRPRRRCAILCTRTTAVGPAPSCHHERTPQRRQYHRHSVCRRHQHTATAQKTAAASRPIRADDPTRLPCEEVSEELLRRFERLLHAAEQRRRGLQSTRPSHWGVTDTEARPSLDDTATAAVAASASASAAPSVASPRSDSTVTRITMRQVGVHAVLEQRC